jgi:hypothetical protein
MQPLGLLVQDVLHCTVVSPQCLVDVWGVLRAAHDGRRRHAVSLPALRPAVQERRRAYVVGLEQSVRSLTSQCSEQLAHLQTLASNDTALRAPLCSSTTHAHVAVLPVLRST